MIDEDAYHAREHANWERDQRRFHGKTSISEEIPNAVPVKKADTEETQTEPKDETK